MFEMQLFNAFNSLVRIVHTNFGIIQIEIIISEITSNDLIT